MDRFWRAVRPLAGALALLVAVLPARAQVDIQTVPAFYVVVEKDKASMQCRIGAAAYPVKTLGVGQVLKVDGQTQSMYRVEYPAGMSAYVKIEDTALEADGKSVKLTQRSRLLAPNSEGGVSWWHLLDENQQVAAGTKLTVQKTVKGPDGKDAGYLVPAPAGSKGFVRRDVVRQATPAEVDSFQGKIPETPGTEPRPAPPAVKPPDQKTPEKPADAPKPVTIEMKPTDGTKPVEPVKAPIAAPGGKLKPADVETLNKIYSEAMSKPVDQVELDAVIAEFQRTIDSLGKDESTERMRNTLGVLVGRLKLRSELQALARQTGTASGALKQQSDQMKAELDRLEKSRQYTVVGRLVASSVYDGKQLPLMYRVLSPEPTSTRTLAYVAPDAKMLLTDKVGKLVGVAGDAKLDEALRVNIVVPTRVDVLGAVEQPEAPKAEAPKAEAPKPTPSDKPGEPVDINK